MIQNRIREELNENSTEKEPDSEWEKPGRSLVSLLFSTELLPKEKALAFLPYFLFLSLLGLFYISNKLHSEKIARETIQLKKEIKELKWDYMSTNSQLMFQSKQSEVASHAIQLGIKETIEPPKKIIIIKE